MDWVTLQWQQANLCTAESALLSVPTKALLFQSNPQIPGV
jgi:hypothetical protein